MVRLTVGELPCELLDAVLTELGRWEEAAWSRPELLSQAELSLSAVYATCLIDPLRGALR